MADISTRTLRCGMPLIVEHNGGVRSAGVQWLLPAGGATDPEDRLGLAEIVSELLLRGAGELDSRAQAAAFERIGVNRSVSSGAAYMKVAASMTADRLADALPLLVDTVRRPLFDGAAIAPARDLALQALESLRDDPQERAVLAARARHFAPPFDRSGYGNAEDLNAITREDVVDAWTVGAVPRGSIMAIAGNVDVDAITAQLDALFDGWSGERETVRPHGDAPRGAAHEMDESNQVQVVVVHDAPPEPHADSMLERLAVAVLSGGMSGRLFTEVREKRGLCYAVSASYRSEKHYGAVTSYVGTTPQRAQESLDVLLAELERLRDGVTQDEFNRAVIGLKSRLVFSGESTSARAAALAGDYHKLGRVRQLEEVAAEIDAIDLDALNAYLARRETSRPTIQTLGPAPLTAPAGV